MKIDVLWEFVLKKEMFGFNVLFIFKVMLK